MVVSNLGRSRPHRTPGGSSAHNAIWTRVPSPILSACSDSRRSGPPHEGQNTLYEFDLQPCGVPSFFSHRPPSRPPMTRPPDIGRDRPPSHPAARYLWGSLRWIDRWIAYAGVSIVTLPLDSGEDSVGFGSTFADVNAAIPSRDVHPPMLSTTCVTRRLGDPAMWRSRSSTASGLKFGSRLQLPGRSLLAHAGLAWLRDVRLAGRPDSPRR